MISGSKGRVVSWRGKVLAVMALVTLAGVHSLAVERFNSLARPRAVLEMQVALPRFVQLLLSGGDRFLAANIAVYRSLIAETARMEPDNYAIQARLQKDAAWFNPAHEDNYYLAAAILPWNRQVDAAQYVLQRASESRPFDVWPSFYFAFDVFMFERDPRRAAEVLRDNAVRAQSERDRMLFESIAARWYQRGATTEETLLFLRGMAEQSRHAALRAYLNNRARRLEGVISLQDAVDEYRRRTGRLPESLDSLVRDGLIASVPADPYGLGYELKSDGQVVALDKERTRQ